MIRIADVRDGTSNTYMIGEKYLDPGHYSTGLDRADNMFIMMGYDNDNYRCTRYAPYQDQPGVGLDGAFGSAHAGGFHLAFCDASVQWINYAIDPAIHLLLGKREDGTPIDSKEY